MKAPWRESSGFFPWLILLAGLLGIAVILKEGIFSFDFLRLNKETVEVTTKVIETLILIVGSILAYFRFFKGRTLKPKLLIKSDCTVIKQENLLQHYIDVEVQNTGTVAIWNHRIEIIATIHGGEEQEVNVSNFAKLPEDLKSDEHLIDVGETSYEHAYLSVPSNAYAVTYQILVFDHNGTMWNRAFTMKNCESKEE